MKCVIPCAGFGVRFQSVVPNTPKALVKIGGERILDRILSNLENVKEVDEVFVVSNAFFYADFVKWFDAYKGSKKVRLICDGALRNDDRKGSVFAVKLVLQFLNRSGVSDDLLVVYGDNVFSFDLNGLVKKFYSHDKSMQVVFDVKSLSEAKSLGVYRVKGDDALELLEKPEHPPSTLCAAGVYAFKQSDLRVFFEDYDLPELGVGHVFMRLVERGRVKVFPVMDSNWVDIGTKESYERALREF